MLGAAGAERPWADVQGAQVVSRCLPEASLPSGLTSVSVCFEPNLDIPEWSTYGICYCEAAFAP